MRNTYYPEKISEVVKAIYEQYNIDISLLDDFDLKSSLVKCLDKDELKIFSSIDIELDKCIEINTYNNLILFVINNNHLDIELKEYLEKRQSHIKDQYSRVTIYFIVDTIEYKIQISEAVNNEFKKRIASILFETKYCDHRLLSKQITVVPTFICGNNDREFKVQIESRNHSLECKLSNTDNHKENLIGYVFSANLFDIVKLYNELGDVLFNKNVRYSIKEELQVEEKIKQTLINKPEEFWFLNNGITMIVKDKSFLLRNSKSLNFKATSQQTISVINGAQTVTAAADFFYSNSETKDIKEKAKENANVILRVMHVAEEEYNSNSWLDELTKNISISLNRQKPIKIEDISYTVPFVNYINEICNSNDEFKDFYFCLTKRGEEASRGYSLVEFARIVTCYLAQSPSEAMSSGANTLLKISSNEDTEDLQFSNEIVFDKEFIDSDEKRQLFLKKYKPVNYAFSLYKHYVFYSKEAISLLKHANKNKEVNSNEENIKYLVKKLDDQNRLAALTYGKWYFIALIIKLINRGDTEDFTYFELAENSSTEIQCRPLINSFIDTIGELCKNEECSVENIKKRALGINDFKMITLYDDLINLVNKDSPLIRPLLDKVKELL